MIFDYTYARKKRPFRSMNSLLRRHPNFTSFFTFFTRLLYLLDRPRKAFLRNYLSDSIILRVTGDESTIEVVVMP